VTRLQSGVMKDHLRRFASRGKGTVSLAITFQCVKHER
jgi:hypothetical protein